MTRALELTGQKFGRLTVIKRVENDKKGDSCWLCKCDCGNVLTVRGYLLKNGRTQSCGCWRIERIKETNKKDNPVSYSRLYKIYHGIKARCFNSKHKAYKDYGGRGITICKEWNNDFKNFYIWATNNGYSDNLTIDRIDVNGNYEPSNCRWITSAEQQQNTRLNKNITYKGETHCVNEWARIYNIPNDTFRFRLFKMGWNMEHALRIPVGDGKLKKYRDLKGECKWE